MSVSPLHELFESQDQMNKKTPLHDLFDRNLDREDYESQQYSQGVDKNFATTSSPPSKVGLDVGGFPTGKRGLYEQYVERPAQIAARGAIGAAESIPRSLVDIAAYVKNLIPGANERHQEVVSNRESMKEKNRAEGKPVFKAPEWFKKVVPSYAEAQENLQKNVPNLAQAENPFERFVEKVGGASALGGAATIPALAGTLGASALAQVGEEAELHPAAQIVLAGIGDLLGKRIHGVVTPGSLLSKSGPFKQSLTPEMKEYFKASEKMGIDPIAYAGNPGRTAQGLGEWASTAPGGYEIAEEAFRKRSGQVADAIEKTLDTAGKKMFSNPLEAGEELKNSIQKATQQVEQRKRQLYNQQDAVIPQNAAITVSPTTGVNANDLRKTLTNARSLLEETLASTPTESRAHRTVQEAIRNLDNINAGAAVKNPILDASGNAIRGAQANQIGIKNALALRRSIRDVIDYARPGGADKLLVPVENALSKVLADYGKTNPAFQAATKEANNYFKNDVVQIRQNIIQALARGETPELALNRLDKASGVKEVKKALSHLPEGDKIFNSLARYKLDRLITDKVFDADTGLMKPAALQKMLSKDSKHTIEALAGPAGYNRLKDISTVGKGLEKGFNIMKNPSQTAKMQFGLKTIFQPASQVVYGITATALGQPQIGLPLIAGGVTTAIAPAIIAKMIYSPEFSRNIYKAALAGKQGHAATFTKYMALAQKELDKDQQEK